MPPDGLSWFLRDTDGHFSSKRLLAYVFATGMLLAMAVHGDPDTIKTLAWLVAGFGGMAAAEHFAPGGK